MVAKRFHGDLQSVFVSIYGAAEMQSQEGRGSQREVICIADHCAANDGGVDLP
jgi:hypothetical protein